MSKELRRYRLSLLTQFRKSLILPLVISSFLFYLILSIPLSAETKDFHTSATDLELISIYLPLVSTDFAANPNNVDFSLIEKRLWDVEETGGSVDSDGSVHCGYLHELHVIVLDTSGNSLNGFAVQSLYGDEETFITGDNEWEDGEVIYNLSTSVDEQAVKVVEDSDENEVTSDVATGITTHSPRIPHEYLINARYCTSTQSCDRFNFSAGCWGHHSWTVTFRQNSLPLPPLNVPASERRTRE